MIIRPTEFVFIRVCLRGSTYVMLGGGTSLCLTFS